MKVLEINVVCGYGSTGRIVVDLYHELKKCGHECKIVYGRKRAPLGLEAIKIGSRLEIYSHVLLTRLLDKHGFGSKKATKQLIEEIEKYGPDLIHLHNIHGYYINIETLFQYLKEVNKPVIWTLHDCWSFTGHCAHFENIGCEKWKTECKNCPQMHTYPAAKWIDGSLKNYRRKKVAFTGVKNLMIVTPSQWLANLVKESYLREYPVEVIPNGVDRRIFREYEENDRQRLKEKLCKKYGLSINKKIILGVASVWTKEKGLDDFIKMAKEDKSFCYILVGITKKIKRILPSNIVGILRTENIEELVGLYNVADVFLNPTYVDTYPTVNIEAKCCGLPVITYRTGGSIETADVIVKKGDYHQLLAEAKKVKKVKGIEIEKFDENMCYKKYAKLIEYRGNLK